MAVLKAVEGGSGRLLLVHRFWTENDERSRHVFAVSGLEDFSDLPLNGMENDLRMHCTPLSEDKSILCADVAEVRMEFMHSGDRGVSKMLPVSSFGTLASGEKYVIYRFVLYWDGFEISRGNSSSGDGVYIQCLNLPTTARSSSNAVRILSLTPPGVDCSEVFKAIEADIVQGITEGFLDYDAEGVQRRIFLDLVGYLGDTPAINSELDTLGHTANACCHLCTYSRYSCSLLGSRYTGMNYCGAQTATGRSMSKHTAIRDSNAGKETCRLLGIKPSADCKYLPLHSISQSMRRAMPMIPKTIDGTPVLSGELDPYKSCFVAPDHLLTGHFRDCVNLAIKLLPSPRYRSKCEDFAIGFLHDCSLPQQNRLFDPEGKKLFSMSMTELYSLSIVAEYSFLKGCEAVLFSQEDTMKPTKKCWDAIELVGSCSRIISRIWGGRDFQSDSNSVSSQRRAGVMDPWLYTVQNETEMHLQNVKRICTMPDSEVREMEDYRRRQQGSQSWKKCIQCMFWLSEQ